MKVPSAVGPCLVALTLALLARDTDAHACSCVAREPSAYLASADAVFVGVAEAQGDTVTMRVLHVLKGHPGKRVVVSRGSDAASGCTAVYRSGEVALVFVRAGKVVVCDGNYTLTYALGLPGIAQIFRTPKPSVPAIATLQRALEATITPYLGGRTDVVVRSDMALGATFAVGATRFTVGAPREPGLRPDDVRITDWVRAGGATFVSGELASEGVRFAVLLGGDRASDLPDDMMVYGRVVIETNVAGPYACAVDADCTATCAAGAVNAAWLARERDHLSDCHDGCTSKKSDAPRCVAGVCTAYFRGAVSDECTRRPIPWRR